MTLRVDSGLLALFGSEDRVRVLAALANAEAPLTAYRVATMVEVSPPNVYRELKRLARFKEVKRASTQEGRCGWALVDPDLRNLLRRRLRIVWSQDICRGTQGRERRALLAVQRSGEEPLDLSMFKPGSPLSVSEVRRRDEKDRVLAKAGAPQSIRSGRRFR